jgi:hypothetical protein
MVTAPSSVPAMVSTVAWMRKLKVVLSFVVPVIPPFSSRSPNDGAVVFTVSAILVVWSMS